MRPRLSIFSASLALALTVSDLDFVMMMTAARYSLPEQDLAAMDFLANINIPAVRDAH